MTKKTKRHKASVQRTVRLSMNWLAVARKVFDNWRCWSIGLKVASIGTKKRKPDAINIQNLPYGKPKQAKPG